MLIRLAAFKTLGIQEVLEVQRLASVPLRRITRVACTATFCTARCSKCSTAAAAHAAAAMLPLLLLIHAVRAMAPPRKYAGPGFRVVRCFPKLSRRDSFGKQRTTRKPGPVYLLGGAMAHTAFMRRRSGSIAAAACVPEQRCSLCCAASAASPVELLQLFDVHVCWVAHAVNVQP